MTCGYLDICDYRLQFQEDEATPIDLKKLIEGFPAACERTVEDGMCPARDLYKTVLGALYAEGLILPEDFIEKSFEAVIREAEKKKDQS